MVKSRKYETVSGSTKHGIVIDDKIILTTISKNNEYKLKIECEMLETLTQLGFCVPRFSFNKIFDEYIMEQEFIKNANFYKLSFTIDIIKEELRKEIEKLIFLLQQNHIVIVDLQFLYTDTKIYIIDPNNIIFLSQNYKHFYPQIKYNKKYVNDMFERQIKILKQLIE